MLAVCARGEVSMASARQSSEKTLVLIPFYQETFEQNFLLKAAGTGLAQGKGGLGFYQSQTATEIEGKQRRGTFFLKLAGQPWENLQYYGAVGIGNSSVDIPSATVTSTLHGDYPGMTYLAGIRSNIFPETEVTPAVSLDMGFSWSRFYFNSMDQHSAGTRDADIRFDTYEYHLGFSASRRFGDWEPYGGVKLIRRQARLKDLSSGEKVGGARDYASPFAGIKLPLSKREYFVAEMTFLDGFRFAAGLEIKLK